MSDQGIVASQPYISLGHRHEELSTLGWTVLTPDEFADDVVGTLHEFGPIIPQFNGQMASVSYTHLTLPTNREV